MGGKIIEFRVYHDLKRAKVCRRQVVPRGLAGPEENGEGDPQPDVDRLVLDRMYLDLEPHTQEPSLCLRNRNSIGPRVGTSQRTHLAPTSLILAYSERLDHGS
jgi:hypothetical protein